MKIVLDLQACQAANGKQGIGRSSLEFTRALARLARGRHDVIVALNAAFPEAAERVKAELRGEVAEKSFVAWQTPVPCDGRNGGEREEIARAMRLQFFETLGADLVHTPSIFEGFGDNAVTAIAPAETRSYVESATLHDLIPLVHKDIYLADPVMDEWYGRKLEDLRRADVLLSVSAFSREEGLSLLPRAPESIVNISSGVGAAFRPDRLPGDVRYRHGIHGGMVMYAGGIDVRKNVERLIQAYAGLSKELRVNRQLAIVCRVSDYHRDLFTNLAVEAGLDRSELVMTGYVSDEDLVALYSSCDVFVFPSWHEGFGLPVLEAMACGAPVITSGVSSLPEVIGREDALFDPLDVGSIRQLIARALSDRAWAAELGEHGRRRAAEFSWERTASAALLAFEHAVATREAQQHGVDKLPRLAYISPLPPERSGISDYSAELLAALKHRYAITVVTPEERSAKVPAGVNVRGLQWFGENAETFDRVVYQFGNSSFHAHMFELIAKHPGVAVLHDFYLSGIVAHLSQTGSRPTMWNEYLYRSHGYAALRFKERQSDPSDSIWKYPTNFPVVERAMQVIVHSRFAVDLAAQWYGEEVASRWRVVPQLRASIAQAGRGGRRLARKRLAIPDDVFLVCSFGMVGPSKLSARLLDAWEQGGFAGEENARLVFVGANQPSTYGHELAARLADDGKNASIAGFVGDSQYLDYLLAADVAVQLRTLSRGETSRAALDCMAAGLPLIVNCNGSMAEIPSVCALKIEDEFDEVALVDALRTLSDPLKRSRMSVIQRDYVHESLSPELVASQYRDAIEAAYNTPMEVSLRALRDSSATCARGDNALILEACEALAFNNPGVAPRQLLVDVSELANRDAKSGIQRVVRGVLDALLEDSAFDARSDYRVEPVYTPGNGRYYYARAFTGNLMRVSADCDDEPINVRRGDVFLGLDLAPIDAVRAERALTDMRLAGAKIFFVIYDVLPMQRPDCFPVEADGVFRPWTEMVARISDGVACISRQVCSDFAEAADALQVERPTRLPIWHFPLGMSLPAFGAGQDSMRPEVEAVRSSARPMVLMVGTLEPRKGHAQALAAMEFLWLGGSDAMLVIVGKQGWMVESLVAQMDAHSERGERLHWLTGVSDEELDALYVRADAVLCASEAEGYGLPLIEAASRGVKLIARDIPVFRDVAGGRAIYFSGTEADDLASVIAQTLRGERGALPGAGAPAHENWHDSAAKLLAVIKGEAVPDIEWSPGRRRIFWSHHGTFMGEGLQQHRGRLKRNDGGAFVGSLRVALVPGTYRLTTIDPLARPDQHPLPEISTLDGQVLEIAVGPAVAHGVTAEFSVRGKVEGLQLSFPPGSGAAVGTLILERLG